MARPLKLVVVHGIGNYKDSPDWQEQWKSAIANAVRGVTQDDAGQGGRDVEVNYVLHDEIFERFPLTAWDWAKGAAVLAASGVWYATSDAETPTARGLFDGASYWMRWHAGMVAQWSAEAALRTELRAAVQSAVLKHQPDALVAHSLGSLICYDWLMQLLRRPPTGKLNTILQSLDFLSLGSQIGNPTVRSIFGGRLVMPPTKHWFHLYNPRDHVMTAPVNVQHSSFRQLNTYFDEPGNLLNHEPVLYFAHPEAKVAWRSSSAAPAVRGLAARDFVASKQAQRPPAHRALLVGINEYADPAANLEGCVNDSYLMSSVLQERGFPAEDIRLLLDQRATAAAIRERLTWLLDDVHPGDIRIFHYSGHGAQIPAYGAGEKVDRLDECLVPHDFDWTLERAIIDDWFYQLYSQLPYGATFLAILDCCHSGGMTRGGIRVRGITPPDDIRHRALRWNAKSQLWEPRTWKPIPCAVEDREKFVGESGAAYRLGRAVPLRRLTPAGYRKTRKELGHLGPFLPILMEACQEHELAEEHRQGSTPYGAFTLALVQSLRSSPKSLSFQDLLKDAHKRLKNLGHGQTPALLGPTQVLRQPVPLFLPPSATKPKPKPKVKPKPAKTSSPGRRSRPR